jgi:hypothetical protein
MWSGIPSTSQQHHRPGLGFRATLFLQADFHIFIDVPTIFWFCLPPLSGTFLQSHSLPHGTGSAASHLGLPTCRAARNGIRRAGEIDGRDLRAHWSWLACPVTTCTQRINKRSVGSTIPRPPLSNRGGSCKSSAVGGVIHNFVNMLVIAYGLLIPHCWGYHISITSWASLTSKAARPFSLRGLKKPLKDVEGR